MQSLDKEQLRNIMVGSTLLGAGGGGSPKSASTLVESAVKISPTIQMLSLNEVDDAANVCVVAGMGSPLAALRRDIVPELVRAFQFMEKSVCGEKIHHVVPLEIGATNTMVPMLVAAHTGATVVDADGAGRAIPELEMTTYAIFGVPISPLVVADPADNVAVVYAGSARDGERIARAISTAYANHAGLACHLMTGAKLREVALGGTISHAGLVGDIIRRAAQEDPIAMTEAILQATQGWLLARGRVSRVTSETREGFDFGSVEIAQEDDSAPLRVITQNENMIAWRGNQPVAIIPDLVCFLDDAGRPLTNADMRDGLCVQVLGIKAHSKWRQPLAWRVFTHALSRLGYDGAYLPIEDLVK